MSERDAEGLSRLDTDRARSMEDEGGVSAALVEPPPGSAEPWSPAVTGVACLVGLVAGVALVNLLLPRRS
jgi:hypothetical protein